MTPSRANAGWWWDLDDHPETLVVSNVTELPAGDPAVAKRYAEYASSNFSDRFRPRQGTEVILDTLSRLPSPRRWLDVAAGTSTWFWALAVDDPDEIVLSDIRPEPLHISDQIATARDFPPAYAEAQLACGLPHDALRSALAARRRFALFDARGVWPDTLTDCDLITMIGFCGLRNAHGIYTTELDGARAALAPRGRLVGVDWIRTEMFARSDGHGSSHISRGVLESRAQHRGLRIITYAEVRIAGDPRYSALCVWCLAHA